MKFDFKPTGITRPVDPLGRIVIPIEHRRQADINEGDKLHIFVDAAGNLLLMPARNVEGVK